MATGRALLISVTEVDPDAYDGEWNGKLRFPEKDAQAIADIAKGFEPTFLKTSEATTERVKEEILAAAQALQAGDIFLMFYSGHGNIMDDESGDELEDGHDETLCLYNGQLLDDELYRLWPAFREGVRVLVLSDSCHSGSITKGGDEDDIPKAMPKETSETIVMFDPDYYRNIRKGLPSKADDVKATIRLISGCQEYERSWENKPLKHGRFTAAVVEAWNDGGFDGNYEAFHTAICEAESLGGKQTPNFDTFGPGNDQFDREQPFSIE
jgi:uncharacterized caspase-like protein